MSLSGAHAIQFKNAKAPSRVWQLPCLQPTFANQTWRALFPGLLNLTVSSIMGSPAWKPYYLSINCRVLLDSPAQPGANALEARLQLLESSFQRI